MQLDQIGLSASATYVVSSSGGEPKIVCEDCGHVGGWSSDGSKILHVSDGPSTLGTVGEAIFFVDLDSGRRIPVVSCPGCNLDQPHFSPDQRWVSFSKKTGDRSSIFLALVRGESPAPEEDWLAVTDGQSWDDKPRWSPDGSLIYFVSNRDEGNVCIWAQRLNAATKAPIGAPFGVYHAHSLRLSLTMANRGGLLELAVAEDKIVFVMREDTGNIWMLEPVEKE